MVCLLALSTAGSCSTATGPSGEVARAKARWTAFGPASYEVTVELTCFCGPESTRPTIVRVRDGRAESRRYADTGAPAPASVASATPTVDELFAIIAGAESSGAATVRARYDAVLGYPVSVFIDYDAGIADDEYSYTMRDLRGI